MKLRVLKGERDFEAGLIESEKFRGFETNVRKNSSRAVRLCRKIGFEIEVNPRRAGSYANRRCGV